MVQQPQQSNLRGHSGLNWGPFDLQSKALPLSYTPVTHDVEGHFKCLYKKQIWKFIVQNTTVFILGSIVVSIPACHAGDRGSIPRRGGSIICTKMVVIKYLVCFVFECICGGVAQMEERSLCMREAQGSIPCISNCFVYCIVETNKLIL